MVIEQLLHTKFSSAWLFPSPLSYWVCLASLVWVVVVLCLLVLEVSQLLKRVVLLQIASICTRPASLVYWDIECLQQRCWTFGIVMTNLRDFSSLFKPLNVYVVTSCSWKLRNYWKLKLSCGYMHCCWGTSGMRIVSTDWKGFLRKWNVIEEQGANQVWYLTCMFNCYQRI